MLNVTQINDFILEAKNEIPAINFVDMVIDDSELTALLKERSESDNHYLIGIVPDFGMEGNENQMKWNNQLMFFVLAKSATRDTTKAQRLTLIGQVQETAKALVNFMLEKKSGDNGDMCGVMNEVNENSITVRIVWEKAQCSGWIVEMDLLTRV